MKTLRHNQGFTLIEVLVYLGLFAMLIGGSVVASYNIIQSNNRSQTRAMVYDEGNFLVAKINWVLSGVSAVNLPVVATPGSQLSVTKWDPSVGSVEVTLVGTDMRLTRPSGTATLNNSNVRVSNLVFNHHNQEGAEWVSASFTLDSLSADGKNLTQEFETTKYLRK